MKKVLLLTVCAVLCHFLAAQTFSPDRDGGWKFAKTGKNGVFTVDKMRVLSLREFKIDPNAVYKLSGKFRSNGSAPQNKLLFFGAEAYDANGKFIGSPQVNIHKGIETVLAKDLAKKDKVIYVKDASKWWRSNYFRLKIGSYITGRDLGIVRKKEGYYLVQLQQPCGITAAAGTPVYLQCNGTADAFFGGTMRGLNNWRSIDALSNTKNHAFSPRHLRPGTKFARLLMRLNQEGDDTQPRD